MAELQQVYNLNRTPWYKMHRAQAQMGSSAGNHELVQSGLCTQMDSSRHQDHTQP